MAHTRRKGEGEEIDRCWLASVGGEEQEEQTSISTTPFPELKSLFEKKTALVHKIGKTQNVNTKIVGGFGIHTPERVAQTDSCQVTKKSVQNQRKAQMFCVTKKKD